MKQYDYIIIGAGPGGYELAASATRTGKSVAIIERDLLGGTCLNRGCIPTKALAHVADVVRISKGASSVGVDTGCVTVDYSKACAHRDDVIARLREGIEMLLAKVDVIRGEARFTGKRTVAVGGEEYTAERIVIATGSRPSALPISNADMAVSSDSLLAMTSLPESMVIIGGGVIGMEFASIFSTLGVKVTVLEYCKEILPQFDKDIAKRLRGEISGGNLDIVVSAEVTAIDKCDAGYGVDFTRKGKPESVTAEMVVMAVGRRAVFPEGLEIAGVEVSRRGIVVDPDTMQTSAEGIYAIGDCNGLCMLAHAASAQGRRVLGEDADLGVIPSVVFTHPECAMVGKTEQQCKDEGIDCKSVKALFRSNGKAMTMEETSGIVKLTYDPTGRLILGCSIMGPHAADLIEEVAVVMANNLTIDAITSTIHPHPTLSEIILQAAMMV